MHTNLNDLLKKSDFELFTLAKNNNDAALAALYQRYGKLGLTSTKKIFNTRGYDKRYIEDFIPELDFVFLYTYRTYSEKKGSFSLYYSKVLSNRVKRFVGRVVLTNDLLRQCISLDQEVGDTTLHELVEDKKEITPRRYVSLKDLTLEIATPLKGRYSKEEKLAKAVIALRQSGYSYRQIAKKVKSSESHVARLYKSYLRSIRKLKMK